MRARIALPRRIAASGNVPAEPYALAQALYERGRWTEAETLCRAILERHADHPGTLTLLGIMLARS
ncbi:MAG TPA: tetratricopeptide repeat protein, partial [Steroidobacteraceae bacterium]|nr:tetratricopeptide repeat protein [Steroidobacteraceae bacterium]